MGRKELLTEERHRRKLESNKRWRQKNKEKIKSYNKKYRLKYGERLKELQRKYNKKRSEETRFLSNESFAKFLLRGIESSIVLRRKELKETFSITVDDILKEMKKRGINLAKGRSGKCAVLKTPFILKHKHAGLPSLDRIDSSKGYIPGNIQLVSVFYNRVKMNKTDKESVKQLKEIGII